MSEEVQMTTQQRKALHLYCQMLADALNSAGLDMKKTLRPEIDIPWGTETVKDFLWRPIMHTMTGKKSTTEMNTHDPANVYEVLNRFMAEKHGVSVEWPDRETLRLQAMGYERR